MGKCWSKICRPSCYEFSKKTQNYSSHQGLSVKLPYFKPQYFAFTACLWFWAGNVFLICCNRTISIGEERIVSQFQFLYKLQKVSTILFLEKGTDLFLIQIKFFKLCFGHWSKISNSIYLLIRVKVFVISLTNFLCWYLCMLQKRPRRAWSSWHFRLHGFSIWFTFSEIFTQFRCKNSLLNHFW